MIQNEKTRDKLIKESANNSFLRQNRHAERDPEITLKFQDGGRDILDELGPELKEEDKSNDDYDIVTFIIN